MMPWLRGNCSELRSWVSAKLKIWALLVDEDFFALNGKLPVNPSGGLAARGHPIGATGLAQIAELVWQMRGEAGPRQVQGRHQRIPQVGLAQNSGGYVEGVSAAMTVTILKG